MTAHRASSSGMSTLSNNFSTNSRTSAIIGSHPGSGTAGGTVAGAVGGVVVGAATGSSVGNGLVSGIGAIAGFGSSQASMIAARDRRGRTGAEAAVFDDDRNGDARIVGRCEGDEQSLMAQVQRKVVRIQAQVVLVADHLRGAGLARDQVGRVDADPAGGSGGPMHDRDHPLLHGCQIAAIGRNGIAGRLRHAQPWRRKSLAGGSHQMQRMADAIGRHRRRRLRQLQQRRLPQSLADAGVDGVAEVPGLLERVRFYSGDGRMPPLSPIRSMPVGLPNP